MSGVSAVALGQLKQAAEKFNDFRRAYPFDGSIERRSASVPPGGAIKRVVVAEEKFDSDKFVSRYRPGNVVQQRFGEFTVPILNISTLADSVFWNHHCFVARGFESYKGDRVIRLEFQPRADVDGPDYAGAALLDSATSILLRVEFQLANPPRKNGPTKLDGYTTFISPSPFVVLPDTTGAVWWFNKPDNDEHSKPDLHPGAVHERADVQESETSRLPGVKVKIFGAPTLVFAIACASAQPAKPGLFPVPHGSAILCRHIVATPSDSAAFIYDFTDGKDSLGQRNALAAFDSTGRPLYMLAFIRDTGNSNREDAFAIRFYPFHGGSRVAMPNPGGTPPVSAPIREPAKTQSGETEMTPDQIEEARRLSIWYWAHRCKGQAQ